jgi:DNA repair protein RecO (recombination protein O)
VSPREHILRTEAIVLRRRNWGEADRILTLFSAQRGKFRAKAVGIRKPRSRKAGHLELFMRSMLLVAHGRELDIITQAETLEAYRPLRDDLLRSAAASYVAEMIDRFSPDEAGSPAAFALLDQTLQALCVAPTPQLVLRHFDLSLLEIMGYRPQLHMCVVGRETIEAQDQFFNPGLGGVVCPRCASRTALCSPLSLSALKVMRHMQREPLEAVIGLTVRPAVMSEVERTLREYTQFHLERPIRSAEFLREVAQEPPTGGAGP